MDQASNNTLLEIMYFRNYEAVHRFAHSPMHRETWSWWYKETVNKPLTIFHELFQVPSGNYETVYGNSAPVLASATQVKINGPKGEAQWVYPIVDARTGE